MLPISTPDRLPDVARDRIAASTVLITVSGGNARAPKDDTRALIQGDRCHPGQLITTGTHARGAGCHGLLSDVRQQPQRSFGADLI